MEICKVPPESQGILNRFCFVNCSPESVLNHFGADVVSPAGAAAWVE